MCFTSWNYHPKSFTHPGTLCRLFFLFFHIHGISLLLTFQTLSSVQFSSVQFSSVSQLCLTVCNPMDCSMQTSLSIINYQSLPKLTSIESVMPSNHLILYSLLLPLSILPGIRVFSNESVLCFRWPKDWSFSFSISPSNEYPGLISFRID